MYGIWLMLLGVLGAANLIIARRPDAAEYINKLAPYQGWIGAISALGGIWISVMAVVGIGGLALYPVYWITWVATGVLQILLGLLLGVGVIKQFVKEPAAVEKMDALITKIAPYQGTMGLIAIGVGIASIVTSILGI